MNAPALPLRRFPPQPALLSTARALDRRAFLRRSLALTSAGTVYLRVARGADQPDRLKPIGVAQGIHPGRVVWARDPELTDWKGPGDGFWWEGSRVKQARVDALMTRSLCELTGQSKIGDAWTRLFRHLNQARGRGDTGYRAGEKILIKPNWVGMIYREGHVNPDTYTFLRRQNYMNTAPQMVIALLRQLTAVGVRPADITVCDTLAYLVNEYHGLLHAEFPDVRYEDYAGKFGRIKVGTSTTPLHWSARPQGKAQDYLPACFAEADYLINFANLKAHTGGGVTLCAKNHYGSLVRCPVEEGYYEARP